MVYTLCDQGLATVDMLYSRGLAMVDTLYSRGLAMVCTLCELALFSVSLITWESPLFRDMRQWGESEAQGLEPLPFLHRVPCHFSRRSKTTVSSCPEH